MARVVFLLKSDKLLGKPNNDYSNKFLNETSVCFVSPLFFFLVEISAHIWSKTRKRLWLLSLSFIFADQFSACIPLVVILMSFGYQARLKTTKHIHIGSKYVKEHVEKNMMSASLSARKVTSLEYYPDCLI